MVGRIVRSRPLSQFANIAHLCERRLRRVFIISPWIVAGNSSEFGPLARVLESVKIRGASLSVLTRPPTNPSHLRAVSMCCEVPRSEILFLGSLHAKLYLLEADDLRASMIGSPNFTPHGDRIHRELAVEIRSIRDSDAGAMLVKDLFLFARELMTDSATYFHKRAADPPIISHR